MRHTLSETLTGLRRNASMTVAVIITMAVSLTLLGIGLLAAQQVDLVKGAVYEKIEVSVFLCTKDTKGGSCEPGKAITEPQRQAVRTALETSPEVASVEYVGKDAVFSEFKQAYAGSPILASMTVDDMQDLFRVKLTDPQQYRGVQRAIGALPGVQNVQDLRQYLDPMLDALNFARWIAIGTAALLLLAAGLQITNTIRMAAFTRRRELSIMRLVGAGNLHIMLPFLLEALVAALAGAAIACGALAAFEQFVIIGKAEAAIQTVQWIGWLHAGIAMLCLVAVAIVLSIIPTLIATRRYLRV